MAEVSHETTIHSSILAAHIKETDRARAYRALSALLASGLTLQGAVSFLLRAQRLKARPGVPEQPVVGALQELDNGKTFIDAFSGALMPVEEFAMVMRVDQLITEGGQDSQVASLLGVAADMLQFDLTMRGAGRNS